MGNNQSGISSSSSSSSSATNKSSSSYSSSWSWSSYHSGTSNHVIINPFQWMAPRPAAKILITGMPGAGKTTLLYKWKNPEKDLTSAPPTTFFFNVEEFTLRQRRSRTIRAFIAWDIGGRSGIRQGWHHYYKDMDAVVFVVDSTDPHDSIDFVRDDLWRMMCHADLQGKPLLVLCNKQDVVHKAKPPLDLAQDLGLVSAANHSVEHRPAADNNNSEKGNTMQGDSIISGETTLPTRNPSEAAGGRSTMKWTVMGSIAKTGKGLPEALNWIAQVLEASTSAAPSSKSQSKDGNSAGTTLEPGTVTADNDDQSSMTSFTTSVTTTSYGGEDPMTDDEEDADEPFDGEGGQHQQHPTRRFTSPLIQKHFTDDGPHKNKTLEAFCPIQNGTQCPFAKAAKLWGLPSPKTNVSTMKEQVLANVDALTEFCRLVQAGESLDGFCLLVQDGKRTSAEGTVEEFGSVVKKVLHDLSDADPDGDHVMSGTNVVGQRGWRFRFASVDLFVTTFAPCYPSTSSRYAFGIEENFGFLLLQPEVSFLRHGIGEDTPETNWTSPTTMRDKTRVAFHAANRSYYIPPTTKYPPAEHIVKPMKDDGTSVIRWWLM